MKTQGKSISLALILMLQLLSAAEAGIAGKCLNILQDIRDNGVLNFNNFESVIESERAKSVFSCFAEESTIIGELFEAYETIEEYVTDAVQEFADEQVRELEKLKIPSRLTNELRKRLKIRKRDKVKKVMRDIKKVLSERINLSEEFRNMREILSDYYKKAKKRVINATSKNNKRNTRMRAFV